MKVYNPFFDTKLIFKTLVTILLVLGAMKVSGGAAYGIVIPIILFALFTDRLESLLFWVLLSNMLVVTNNFFAPKGSVFAIGFRVATLLVGLIGAFRFFSVKGSRLVMPLMGIFFYILYMFLPSLQGWAPRIACLKLLLFAGTFMAFAYISTKIQAKRNFDMRRLRSMLLAFCLVYVVGSALLYPFPGISQMNAEELERTGTMVTSLYKGMTNHSQTLGAFMCCWMVYLLADMLFNIQKPSKLYILLLFCGGFSVFQTSSRTAMGALVAVIAFLTYNMMQMKGVKSTWKSKVVSTLLLLISVSATVALVVPSVRDKIARIAMKYDADVSAKTFDMEKALSSRMGLVEVQLYNFKLKPSIGWGFQVTPEVGELEKMTGGLVLSAPVEKGVWITAILEEGGIIGWIIYVAFAIFAFFTLMARRAYMGATVFLLIHISNLGEFTMFSMSSVGCVWYVVLFISLIFDAKRLQGNVG